MNEDDTRQIEQDLQEAYLDSYENEAEDLIHEQFEESDRYL